MRSQTDRSDPPLATDEAALLELYRRMRRGQQDMFRELAALMVNREQPPERGAQTTRPPE